MRESHSGVFGVAFLFEMLLCVCGQRPGFAPAGEFLFVRDKKEPKSASATLSGRTPYAPASLRSNRLPEIRIFIRKGRDACARRIRRAALGRF